MSAPLACKRLTVHLPGADKLQSLADELDESDASYSHRAAGKSAIASEAFRRSSSKMSGVYELAVGYRPDPSLAIRS